MEGEEKTSVKLAHLLENRQNRIVLLMFGALSLMVFMDVQARRHYAALSGSNSATGMEQGIEMRRVEDMPGEEYDSSAVVDESRYEGVEDSLAPLLEEEAVLRPLDPPPVERIVPGSISLYYIRFEGRSSTMVRVNRSYDRDTFDYESVLKLLQKGPLLKEKGLLNAFDSRIIVHSVRVKNGIAYVDLNNAVNRMNAKIIRDRVDQLVLTLTDFSEVRGVKLYIDGRPVAYLGDNELKLPEIMGRPDREIDNVSN